MKKKLQRVLLIRTDRIGDVVLTTPVATVLKTTFPGVHVSFLGHQYTAPLLEMYQDIDEVLTYQPEKLHRGWSGHLLLASQLKEKEFDAAFLFFPRPALAFALKKSNIPLRVGSGYRWYSFLFSHRVFEHRKYGSKHELEYNLSLLKPFINTFPERIQFRFKIPSQLETQVKTKLNETGINKSYVVIHPGSGGSAPNLSIEQYISIARRLSQDLSLQLVFTGSQDEQVLVERILKEGKLNRAVNLSGLLTLPELMVLLKDATLFVSSSTGPLHLANALNTPIVSFYCPSPPCSARRWGPYHQLDWVITPNVEPCKDCNPKKCPHNNCLGTLDTETILEKITKRLQSS
ncbi:MAG: lipopolysaccharide heptosyltransferase family protein [Calditrichaeota bacterium]|nr:MAG: lipopolysaccharide heptosyltransferase family protein [Calditrichota bacterium]